MSYDLLTEYNDMLSNKIGDTSFDTNSDDYYLYVEKNGCLKQCKYKPIAKCEPIRINKDNVLYCKKIDSLGFLDIDSNIDFLNNEYKHVYFDDYSEDHLELTEENLKKYKFYKCNTNTSKYERIYISQQNENGNFVSQDVEKVTVDAGEDNSPTKLKNSDISKMKQEVEKLKTQNNTVNSNYQRLDGEYLRLLIQIHNTNYNVQESKESDYINICNDREFKKGIFQKSKTGYCFDIKDLENNPKRYYFFNKKKKNELIKLMQSCDALIAEGKLDVDEKGNIVSLPRF